MTYLIEELILIRMESILNRKAFAEIDDLNGHCNGYSATFLWV